MNLIHKLSSRLLSKTILYRILHRGSLLCVASATNSCMGHSDCIPSGSRDRRNYFNQAWSSRSAADGLSRGSHRRAQLMKSRRGGMEVPSSMRSSSPTVSITPCFHFPWTCQPCPQWMLIKQYEPSLSKKVSDFLQRSRKLFGGVPR